MKVIEAKELVLGLIQADLATTGSQLLVNSHSPDGDEGKFLIDGKSARAIHHVDTRVGEEAHLVCMPKPLRGIFRPHHRLNLVEGTTTR